MIDDPALVIRPANEAACADLAAVFGSRGAASVCRCQRYKLAPREAFKHHPPEVRADRLRVQTGCGNRDAPTTAGLIAFLDGEPVGWCAVEPRSAYAGLARVYRVPWEGRSEDKTDPTVWAVTCLLVRAGFRGRRISYALARAAVEHARSRGARALEAYPMITQPGQEITWDEIHVGTVTVFAAAGLTVVHQPTIRRVVMRIDL
ncbi:MAG TPA: GNAT family N-acetyltransferase [Candidatus Limnocylindrales bacterium]